MVLATGAKQILRMIMKKLRVSFGILLLVLFVAGCSKESEAPPEGATGTGKGVEAKPLEAAPVGKETIPGENAVKEALAQKQYSAAVERFGTLKQAVVTPEQNDAYMSLYGQMRTELEEAARSDTKAAEALAMFRYLRNQR